MEMPRLCTAGVHAARKVPSVLHLHCQCMLCLVGGGGGKVKDTLREVVTPDKVRAEGRWGQTKLFYLETTFFGHF